MQFQKNSNDRKIDIEEFYSVKIKSLWQGFKQEHMSFWALCAYFFFEYVRPQSIYPALEIVPWAQLTLLLTLVTAYMDKSIKWVENPLNKIFIGFIFIVVLSGVFAFRPSVSWDAWTVMFNWVLIYFLVINIVNSEKRFFIFILLYLLFSFKMSQHGFRTFAGRGFSFTRWGLIGAGGWFQNSGEFAIQMLIFSSLAGAFVLALKDKWGRVKKWFFYLMPFTGLMSVLGASSRGSQLALAAIGIALIFRSKGGFKAIFAIILIGSFLYFVLPDEQIARFEAIGSDTNSKARLAYWSFGMEVIRDNPILGIGYNNWLSYAMFLMPEGIFDGKIQQPHNIFIQAGSELGITGFICFVLMIIYVFIINSRTRKLAKKSGNTFNYYMAFGLDYGLLGYIIAGFFVTVLYYPFFWVQMSLSVALYAVANQVAGRSGKEFQKDGG